jgi:hypothetical protein
MQAKRAELIARARHKRAYGRRYVVLTMDEFDALVAEDRLQRIRELRLTEELARHVLRYRDAYTHDDKRSAYLITHPKRLSNPSQTLANS